MLHELNTNQTQFWKTLGKTGIKNVKNDQIPQEVVLDDGSVSRDLNVVLQKWEQEFKGLLNSVCKTSIVTETESNSNCYCFEDVISVFEVKKVIDAAKCGKAHGIDNIPADVLKNSSSISFIHSLFNVCFKTGKIPSIWSKNIINPIPKSSTGDNRDPLSYRGITLACSVYKLYASVLNNRLNEWAEENNVIVNEQNGFRKERSTIDHVISLTSILDTRKDSKLSTFCAFIDFRKAYDTIHRDILWNKLSSLGIHGKMLQAVKSLYTNVSACVRVNGHFTDWFDVNMGLRQGCSLSPLLFNLFINDLATMLKSLGMGVPIGDDRLCTLLYADDIVILAENESDLEIMLNNLFEWCNNNCMSVNLKKSNVAHFRPSKIEKTKYVFKFGNNIMDITEKYTYLGIMLTEHLDYNLMAKVVAQSASRALGLLITKCKSMGGLPFPVYTKLYDSLVQPVISYGAAVWGTKSYSCIEAVQNRAMKFFLGTGKCTPSAAVIGDMGWEPALVRQWKCVISHWYRCKNWENTDLRSVVFNWALSNVNNKCHNWCSKVKKELVSLGFTKFIDGNFKISKKCFVNEFREKLMSNYVEKWKVDINRTESLRSTGGNKLRFYNNFKSNFKTEEYCQVAMPFKHKSALAKFRCGVAPLRVETGRYVNMPWHDRVCLNCNSGSVEDEMHVLIYCNQYTTERDILFNKAILVETNFYLYDDFKKVKFLLSNAVICKETAKTLYKILVKREKLMFN